MEDMSCQTFRRHLGHWAWLEHTEGGWTRYFSLGFDKGFEQDHREMIEERRFVNHFNSCLDCQVRYQNVGVNSIPAAA